MKVIAFAIKHSMRITGVIACGFLFITAGMTMHFGTTQSSYATSATSVWTGDFTGFGKSPGLWSQHWGVQQDGSFGWPQMKAISDPALLHEKVLQVTYQAHSSANSCGSCPPGGGQFYAMVPGISHAKIVYLLYYVKFNHDQSDKPFDWGKAGKLPGLWGGPIGSESGGNSSDNAWSTRLMWRVTCPGRGSVSSPKVGGELYLYPGNQQNAICGSDSSNAVSNLGWNQWQFTADAKWHSIEQEVDLQTGQFQLWYDGILKYTRTLQFPQVSVAGILFSTFYGGHDSSWGPSTDETADFAHFVVKGQ